MKTKYDSNPNEFKVGIFILVPLVIIALFIILKLGYFLIGSTIDVYLKVDNISNIKNGTSIRLKGYEIGRIVDLKPVYKPELHFLATMRIMKDIELNENCSAVILNQNIIGDTVIEIRNPDKKGMLLRDGDVIEGLEYVNLEAVLNDVHNLLIAATETVNVLKDMSLDSKQNIKALIANIESSTASTSLILSDSQKEIPTILQSLRETTKTASEISTELKKRPAGFILSGSKDK
ncbi:MAG: MlaD family protein [Spirochaetes bacterium]|nr:MlaD family protein [Spirochaetota bacterium]